MTRRAAGRYEIVRELARSGSSTVHLAWQPDRDRYVALKELHATAALVAGDLSHPNIVPVYDAFQHDGRSYVAMEYFERGSLGELSREQIGRALEDVLAGLRHAETHGAVHGHLKPANLMLTADGRVKIADFGIATARQVATSSTVTGVSADTAAYMAPEQATGGDIGAWTDLYSVGCIAFELFTGRTPFDASEAPMATLVRHVKEPIPPVKSLVPEVDPRVSDWIERLLVKDPARRTRHADEAWAQLREILVTPPPRRRRRWTVPAALAGGLAAVAAGALGAYGREGAGSPDEPPVALSGRGVAIEVPADWRRGSGGEPVLPGVAHSVVARGPAGQRVVLGRGDRRWANQRLLPRALDAGRAARAVTLRDGAQALRYDAVRIAGRSASVYSAPTSKGVVTVTCLAPARTCSAVGASLRITEGTPVPLGPDPAFIAGVGRVLRWLEKRERPIAAELRQATTPAGRVAATKKLWWTYAGASKRLRKLDVGPADKQLRRQLAEALRLAGCAYGRAAGHRDRAGYEREGELALVHQGDLRRGLDGLVDAGYELPPGADDAARFTRLVTPG